MEKEVHQRLLWVKPHEEGCSAGLVCRRCGISRPGLRETERERGRYKRMYAELANEYFAFKAVNRQKLQVRRSNTKSCRRACCEMKLNLPRKLSQYTGQLQRIYMGLHLNKIVE